MKHAIAIVGMGPRGLFAFERLAAHLRFLPPGRPVEIHLFNRTPFFGAGENFRPDQPEYLRLNFAISHVDVWPRGAPRPAPDTRHDLESWLREVGEPEKTWTAASNTSRANVGRYLDACFDAIVDALPESARVVRHQAELTDLERHGDGFRLTVRELSGGDWETTEPEVAEPGTLDPVFDHVLLATGHTPDEESDEGRHARRFAEQTEGVGYVGHPLPVGRWMDDLPAGARVALRGMGLTFIDVATTLTEGRGGRFVEDDRGEVRYQPSGDEPEVILPVSPSGRLPTPKPRGPWPRRDRYVPKFFTREAVERLRAEADGGRVDFERQAWPLLEREMAYEYYRAALLAEERPRLAATAGDPEAFDALRPELERCVPDLVPFDLGRMLDPRTEGDFASPEAHHEFTVGRLAWELEEACRGREHSPFQAALEVWNKVFPLITSLVEFDGLTAASHRAFDAERKRPMARATYGPPIENAAKILALARAGLLDFGLSAAGEVEPDEEAGAFRVTSGRIDGAARHASWLIEARLPGNDLANDASPLLRKLRERGLIRGHVNRAGRGEPYATGGVDLLPGTGTVIGRDGVPVPGLAATGWMTEGPLVGNDALFREVNDMSGAWAAHVVESLRRKEASKSEK